MNKSEELQEKIAKIKSAIEENYPELSHEIKEMPEEDTQEALADYFESLVEQFRDYIAEHQLPNPNRKYKDHHL